MTAPDRIWAWPWAGETSRGQWSVMAYGYGMTTEYIRADLATPAAIRAAAQVLSENFDTLPERIQTLFADGYPATALTALAKEKPHDRA